MPKFKCSQCGAVLDRPENLVGKKSKCDKCGKEIEVPGISLSEIDNLMNSPHAGTGDTIAGWIASGTGMDSALQVFDAPLNIHDPAKPETQSLDEMTKELLEDLKKDQ